MFPVLPNMKRETVDAIEMLVSYLPKIVVTLQQQVFVAV
jgi:hypothetical protein